LISQSEIRNRATDLGVQESHIERDYVLNHLLASTADKTHDLIFRGGTALARVYWPDFRLSEDLDFVCLDRVPDLSGLLHSIIGSAADSCGRKLSLEYGEPRNGWSRSHVRWDENGLLLDVNLEARPAIEPLERTLVLPYSDLGQNHRIAVVDVSEILGNKWFMLDDREEARDLFDLWAGLCVYDIPFAEVERGHRARYGYPPPITFVDYAKKLKDQWELRLVHQVAELPPFDVALGEVRSIARAWQDARGA
jgi:predicted nucleotidyltransferase component of viral defense system